MAPETLLSPKELFKNFVQIGVVVADLDQVARNLSEIFGIGPFYKVEWPPRSDMRRFYHGEQGEFTARLAFSDIGPVELELIQPLEGDSIWADFLRERGPGIHHIRFNVEAIEPVVEYLSRHGIEPSQYGDGLRPGTTWVNFDTENQVGFVIEIMNAIRGTDGRTPRQKAGEVQE